MTARCAPSASERAAAANPATPPDISRALIDGLAAEPAFQLQTMEEGASLVEYLDLAPMSSQYDDILDSASAAGLKVVATHMGAERDEFFTGLYIVWLRGADGRDAEGYMQFEQGLVEFVAIEATDRPEMPWVVHLCGAPNSFAILVGVSAKIGELRVIEVDPSALRCDVRSLAHPSRQLESRD